MDYPEYAIEAARCRSFAEWPRTVKQKPKELAEAGFFYTGIGDRVNCFSCGGGLKDWGENDEPWEQHAQWLSKCRYLKLMKGTAFIDAVIAKCNRTVEKTQEVLSTATGVNQVHVQVFMTQREEHKQNWMESGVMAAVAMSTTATSISSAADRNLLQQNEKLLNSQETIIPEEKFCKICYEEELNTVFLPCGHVVACTKCASSVIKCPMCRKPFKDVMRRKIA